MAPKAHTQYIEALKGLGKWEHAMKLIEKYTLLQAANGLWLQDISQAIKTLSDALCIVYGSQADGIARNKPSEYQVIAK
jgi:hypothetical protein